MVMTLHTLQFNPIINILTQKRFLREYLFFRQGTLSAPLFGLGGAHGRSECSEKKIKLESVDLDVKL